jgi:hypothetical protein
MAPPGRRPGVPHGAPGRRAARAPQACAALASPGGPAAPAAPAGRAWRLAAVIRGPLRPRRWSSSRAMLLHHGAGLLVVGLSADG